MLLKCDSCEKSFKSQRGLSLHRRKVHPILYHEEKAEEVANAIPIKKKWTTNDLNMMVKIEANLLKMNTRFINQELAKRMPDRSVESIKGKRRNEQYKQMVINWTNIINDQELSDQGPSENDYVHPSQSENETIPECEEEQDEVL